MRPRRTLLVPLFAIVSLGSLALPPVAPAQEEEVDEFQAKRKELSDAYRKATTPEEKRAILEEFRKLSLLEGERRPGFGKLPTADELARITDPLSISSALGLGSWLAGDGRLNARDVDRLIRVAREGGFTVAERRDLREVLETFKDALTKVARQRLEEAIGALPPEAAPELAIQLATDSNNDGTIDATDDSVEDREARRVIVNDDDDGSPAGPDHANDVVDGSGDLRDMARLRIEAKDLPEGAAVALEARPAGKIRVFGADGKVLLAKDAPSAAVPAAALGTDLFVEGCAEGDVVLTATVTADRKKASDSVKVRVEAEKIYLFLFGYQGTEENYLASDVQKLYAVVDHLKKLGYQVYDDGASFDQGVIDAAFTEEHRTKHPKKVIVDRATTRAEFLGYLDRGTVRGLFWGSHGYMEPFIGCRDEELLTLESRIWSCPPGRPADTESRNFVREVESRLARQAQLPLDFAILHSCATGGLGSDYWKKPWDYTHPDTKRRVQALHGRFPPAEELGQKTFEDLKPYCGYLITYSGSAYFGMHDVNRSLMIRSIKEVKR